MKVELGVSEGLLHGYSAEFALVSQLVVEEEEMTVGVNPRLNMVQYKYTTYCVPMPDVPDNAIHVGVGYVGRSEGTAGLWAFVPVDVAVPVAVIGAAIEDRFHDFSVGDSTSGFLFTLAWTEPADGGEAGGGGVFGHGWWMESAALKQLSPTIPIPVKFAMRTAVPSGPSSTSSNRSSNKGTPFSLTSVFAP